MSTRRSRASDTMIIRYPTGFYSTILPSSGNVTFTISNNLPPRSDLSFQKVPIGIVSQKKKESNIDPISRRKRIGPLIFSISRSGRTNSGNDSKKYEVGQVLEFNTESGRSVAPMLIGDLTETRHDTNIPDYTSMGLTEADQEIIFNNSLLVQSRISDRLNELKTLRKNAEQIIDTQQKLINEISRTIASLQVMSNQSSDNQQFQQMISKLTENRNNAFVLRDNAIREAESYAEEAAEKTDELRAVGVLVK